MDNLSNTVETQLDHLVTSSNTIGADERLIGLVIKHLGITTPVVVAGVKNGVLHLTLLGGGQVSCRLDELEGHKPGKTLPPRRKPKPRQAPVKPPARPPVKITKK